MGILEVLAEHPNGLTARQISHASNLNVSTCHHLLATLVNAELARVDSHHRYFLGPKIAELYRKYTVGTSVVQRIRHLLEDLSFQTLSTSYLAVWRDGNVVLVDVVETIQPALQSLHPGYTGPAHCRASGKVLLAALPEEELAAYLRRSPLVRRTPNTITSEDELRAELERVRSQGYAVDREEFAIGWFCVAAPVTNRRGDTVGAIAISFARDRSQDLEGLVHKVLDTTRFASAELGDFI